MGKKQKYVFIFDFDGVFYSGEHKFDNINSKINNHRHKFLGAISKSDYDLISKENPEWFKCFSGSQITKFILNIKDKYPNLNLTTKHFYNWQHYDHYNLIIDYNQIIKASFIKNLCRNYPVYILTNSSYTHIKYYMKKLNIKPAWFKKIISNEFKLDDLTKKHYMQKILNKEKCESNNAYMIGDSLEGDIKPAKELNINTFYVKNSNDVEPYIKSIIKK